MKKIIFLMTLLFSSFVSVNAQIATENSNALDNVYVGVLAGATTPLDFNSVFPVNPVAGITIGKDFTPVFGMNLEGLAIFNDNHFTDIKTSLKAINVGVNTTFNLTNMFCGYKGTPRFFEVGTVTGIGMLHEWNTSENYLTAKTGLDLKFNLGRTKAHSLIVTPAIYWNLNKFNDIQFNKKASQLALTVTYVYHFKTSNGTRHFKVYDIGAMELAQARLAGMLEECNNRPAKVVEVVKEVPVEVVGNNQWVVMFAKNSAELTAEAKQTLDKIDGTVATVVGLASPEGSNYYNTKLSQQRADNVAEYLRNKGVTVEEVTGKGVLYGKSTNRLVIVTK